MALKDPLSPNEPSNDQPSDDNAEALKTILAQELLPEWLGDYQQVIALHMLELKKHVPSAYIDEFQVELDWLNDFIKARYSQANQQEHEQEITLLTLSQGYKLVVKQKQLKDRPLPGFVCCELNTLGSQRTLFLRYKSLVLLSSIRVFLKTSPKERQKWLEKGLCLLASSIKNATNEVRWITVNRRPDTLDNLPDPCELDLEGLFKSIDEHRNHAGTPEAIKTSLNKYHTVFSNAYHKREGIRKNRGDSTRSGNKSQLQALEVSSQDEVTVTEIRTSIEKTQNVAQWQREEDLSSPPDAARYIVAINAQTTKNNQLNGILAHRYADQLKVRQQSAPCDYQGLTEYEVQTFVQHCISECQTSPIAQELLCSLAFGKSIAQLSNLVANETNAETSAEKIWPTGSQMNYQLFHILPSSKLSRDKDFLLPDVEQTLIIDCPRYNAQGLYFENDGRHKTFVSQFNRNTGTRVTLGRIARYKKEWLAQQGVDESIIALLHNLPLAGNSGLSYSQFTIAKLQATHLKFINHICNNQQPIETPISSPSIGTRLTVNDHMLQAALAQLAANINNLCKLSVYHPLLHAEYTTYIHYLLALATGYRPVNGMFGTIDDFDLVTNTLWISDKESRQGIAARILHLPTQATEQVCYYLDYLKMLLDRYRFENPILAKRIQQALDGSNSLLFGIYPNAQDYTNNNHDNDIRWQFVVRKAHQYSTEIIELTPKYISDRTSRILPLPNNWHRHYMRNKLIGHGVNPTIVDTWMGHEPIGAEGFGRFSNLGVSELKNIAQVIEQIFASLSLSPINIKAGK